jgi:hypothetical protein
MLGGGLVWSGTIGSNAGPVIPHNKCNEIKGFKEGGDL